MRMTTMGAALLAATLAQGAHAQGRPNEKAFLDAFLNTDGENSPKVAWSTASYAPDGSLTVTGMSSSIATAKGRILSYSVATTTFSNPRLANGEASADRVAMGSVSIKHDNGTATVSKIDVEKPARSAGGSRFESARITDVRLNAQDGATYGSVDGALVAATDWIAAVPHRMSVRIDGMRYRGPVPRDSGQDATRLASKSFSIGWDYAYAAATRSVDYQAGAKFGDAGEGGALRLTSRFADVDAKAAARQALSPSPEDGVKDAKLSSAEATYVDDGLAEAILASIAKGDSEKRRDWAALARMTIAAQGAKVLGADAAKRAGDVVASFITAPKWIKVAVNPPQPIGLSVLKTARPESMGISVDGP